MGANVLGFLTTGDREGHPSPRCASRRPDDVWRGGAPGDGPCLAVAMVRETGYHRRAPLQGRARLARPWILHLGPAWVMPDSVSAAGSARSPPMACPRWLLSNVRSARMDSLRTTSLRIIFFIWAPVRWLGLCS